MAQETRTSSVRTRHRGAFPHRGAARPRGPSTTSTAWKTSLPWVTGMHQARLDVFLFQPGVAFQQDFWTVTRSKHPQHVLDGQPATANDRLAARGIRIHCDAFEKFLFVHRSSSARLPIVS